MIAVVQRVCRCSVLVDDVIVGAIGRGLLVLLGVSVDVDATDVEYLADKIPNLRIFEDDAGKMNRSLTDAGGHLLVVSQFTLLGDSRKGRRPSFITAAGPQQAEPLYRKFIDRCRAQGVTVETGRFGASMAVSLVNDGPVTLIVESPGHRSGGHRD
ncbi:MAG: D-aminoacyl-tRNA deacylase [Pseudomonadota bacterium]